VKGTTWRRASTWRALLIQKPRS